MLLQNLNGMETLSLTSSLVGLVDLTCLCRLLAHHWPFNMLLIIYIYYALLFYIPAYFPSFSHLQVVSVQMRAPPIYNCIDDLLNFYFFMITYLRCSVKQWS